MKTYGIERITIRLTITFPECSANIQRLYDYGAWFKLNEETITDTCKIAEMITHLKERGGRLISSNKFISDDDFQEKQTYTYEAIIK